jgi:hypothetical protein
MEKTLYQDIFTYIETQESAFKKPINLANGWPWNMKDHIELSYLYNNSQLKQGKGEFTPVKNITRPILNLQHRAEDIELTDVQLYVDEPDNTHLSFLVKKYHDEVFVRDNDLDTFFDELNVSRIDYGGGLSKLTSKGREVVPLQSIAFCDQTDILSGPIGIKHFFSPDQLQDMGEKGWGNAKNGATATIAEAITLAQEYKKEAQSDSVSDTPGKYVEVYEVHGSFPKRFIDPEDKSGTFSRQIHIVCFYQKTDSNKGNIVLYKAEESTNPFKLIKRDPVYGRALGFGGAEELFEAQVWVNYDMIRMQSMLDAAAITVMITQDPTLAAKHPGGLKDMNNMEFIEEAVNGNTRQLDTFPRNLALFEKSIAEWEAHAKDIGASQDPLQGKEPTAGTPFSSLQAQIQQGMGLHEYRKGQYARHIEEIYEDDYIPKIIKEITKGSKFLAELTLDEVKFVAESMADNMANARIKEMILAGKMVTPEEQKLLTDTFKENFQKKGSKHFIEILKGEFKDKALKVKVTVNKKSKNLSQMTDKITNIFRFVFANPQGFAQVMQIPGMARSFSEMLEYSGMSPVDFSNIDKLAISQPQPSPIQDVKQPIAA